MQHLTVNWDTHQRHRAYAAICSSKKSPPHQSTTSKSPISSRLDPSTQVSWTTPSTKMGRKIRGTIDEAQGGGRPGRSAIAYNKHEHKKQNHPFMDLDESRIQCSTMGCMTTGDDVGTASPSTVNVIVILTLQFIKYV